MGFNPHRRYGARETRMTPKANARTWKPSPSHATWCSSNVPYNREGSVGNTPMARTQCSCRQNSLAKSLRKLAEYNEQRKAEAFLREHVVVIPVGMP